MKFGILANIAKPALKETLSDILAYLKQKKMPVILKEDLARWSASQIDPLLLAGAASYDGAKFVANADCVIALGGDGTILSTARLVGASGKPILGINLGKLGFLAEVSTDETQRCIDDLILGNYFLEERMVLEGRNLADNIVMYALNELVIDKGAHSRVIELEMFVNNDYMVTYSADGIILNTPTGSTAYSLASGGPIVNPLCNVITINPISPHTLTARPVIVPDSSQIKVIVRTHNTNAHVTADGQVDHFFSVPSELTIRKADYTIKLIKRKNRTYYDLLRTKLQWGQDIRTRRG